MAPRRSSSSTRASGSAARSRLPPTRRTATAGGACSTSTPSGSFATGIPAESRFQLLERLPGARLETRAFLQPVSLEAGAITAKHRLTGEPATIEADAVIWVGERRPAGTDELELPAGARV